MRHRKKGRKLGTDASHTKAMKKGLVAALFANDRIKTTLPRAKEIRGDVDRVITWAKRGDLHSRRLAIAKVGDQEIVREVFEKVEQGMFCDRNGGYTRIYKLGNRKGDNAPMVIMELVTESYTNPTGAGETKAKEEKPAKEKELKGKAAEKAAAEELNAKFQFEADEADIAAEAAAEAAEEAPAEEAAETVEEAVEEAAEEAAEAAEDAPAEETAEDAE